MSLYSCGREAESSKKKVTREVRNSKNASITRGSDIRAAHDLGSHDLAHIFKMHHPRYEDLSPCTV